MELDTRVFAEFLHGGSLPFFHRGGNPLFLHLRKLSNAFSKNALLCHTLPTSFADSHPV
jgi:hypothetical protein